MKHLGIQIMWTGNKR